MRIHQLILACCLLALTAGCRQPEPPAGSRELPPGDAAAGKQVFMEMRCWACHEIYGGDMPQPVASPAVPVYLGGNQIAAPDDLYLLRAIVEPSHELAPGWDEEMMTREGRSRMGDYGEAMTARQLFDLIAFLKSRYRQ
ncbi:MAG TPA: c-type cytochrome [Thermoanaerobaculia bacterium]|nr:c-type cytochrome [Thermoanaerobaculia bacterium]